MVTKDIEVVRYAENEGNYISRYYAAYLTKNNDVILSNPFSNLKYAVKTTNNIMRGKRSESQVPLIVALTVVGLLFYFIFRDKYDKDLVRIVASGEVVKVVVIENGPDEEAELRQFAESILKVDK
ncbi:hypothetical protein ACFLTB_02715 [Chloroflexota bacterium]